MTAQPDNTSDEQPKEIFFKKDLPTVLDNQQAAQSTIDSEVEKQIADILGWWKARRKYIKWVGETYDSDAEPRDEEMAGITKLIAQEANKARLDELLKAEEVVQTDNQAAIYSYFDGRHKILTADKEQA